MHEWYNKNNVDKNIEFLEKLMKYYNICKYNIMIVDGLSALCVVHKCKAYVGVPEPENERIRVICPNLVGRKKGYHLLKNFGENGYLYGDNCWVRFFKEISKK